MKNYQLDQGLIEAMDYNYCEKFNVTKYWNIS